MQSTSQPHQEPGLPSTDPVSPPEPPNPCQEQLNALEEAIVQFENAQKLIQERADALLECQIHTARTSLNSHCQSVVRCDRVKNVVSNCYDNINHTSYTLRRILNLW